MTAVEKPKDVDSHEQAVAKAGSPWAPSIAILAAGVGIVGILVQLLSFGVLRAFYSEFGIEPSELGISLLNAALRLFPTASAVATTGLIIVGFTVSLFSSRISSLHMINSVTRADVSTRELEDQITAMLEREAELIDNSNRLAELKLRLEKLDQVALKADEIVALSHARKQRDELVATIAEVEADLIQTRANFDVIKGQLDRVRNVRAHLPNVTRVRRILAWTPDPATGQFLRLLILATLIYALSTSYSLATSAVRDEARKYLDQESPQHGGPFAGIANDIRPEPYQVEWKDPTKLPQRIKSQNYDPLNPPKLLLLGQSGNRYVLYWVEYKLVLRVSADEVNLFSAYKLPK